MYQSKLAPEHEVIVVLDTSVARGLGFSSQPDWVETFASMSRDGYRFSLADVALGELLLQVRDGRTSQDQHQRMLASLQPFLDGRFPVLPSGVDLLAMLGCSEEPIDLEETAKLAETGWALLSDSHVEAHVLGPPLEVIRDQEREDWPEWLTRVARHAEFSGIDLGRSRPDDVAEHLAELARASLDSKSDLSPPMSVRRHLEVRYRFRQMARTRLEKHPYNPRHPKKQNDGMDVDLYQYLMLPALVLTCDNGFFGSIESISSFQRNWFKRPEELAAKWMKGERPAPKWPV